MSFVTGVFVFNVYVCLFVEATASEEYKKAFLQTLSCPIAAPVVVVPSAMRQTLELEMRLFFGKSCWSPTPSVLSTPFRSSSQHVIICPPRKTKVDSRNCVASPFTPSLFQEILHPFFCRKGAMIDATAPQKFFGPSLLCIRTCGPSPQPIP